MNKKYFLYFAIVLLNTFNFFAQELIPLEVNNKWVYEETITSTDGTVEKDTVTNTVKSAKIIDGIKWFNLEEFGFEYIVRNTEEGQIELDTISTPNKKDEVLFYKQPIKKEIQKYTAFEVNTITVPQKTEVVVTPIGKFKCYKYEITTDDFPDDIIYVFIKPKVGVIKNIMISEEETVESVLIDYKLF